MKNRDGLSQSKRVDVGSEECVGLVAQAFRQPDELVNVQPPSAAFDLDDERDRLAHATGKFLLTDPSGHAGFLDDLYEDVVLNGSQGTDAFAIHPTNLVDKWPTKVVGFGLRESFEMALQPCPDCHMLVSDSAPACPNCGRSHPTAKRAGKTNQLAGSWGFVALAVIGMIIFMFFCRSDPSLVGMSFLIGMTPVIMAVKHLVNVLKRKEW